MLDKIALTLLIIGGLNWGCVGIFRFDIVAWLFGGQVGIVSKSSIFLSVLRQYGVFRCFSKIQETPLWKTRLQ